VVTGQHQSQLMYVESLSQVELLCDRKADR
jgi:hypothetical protein